jgi:hypothetical protein
MKFNDVLNEQGIWAIIKSELELDGKIAMELTRRITKQLRLSCETALKMDRIELREELEAEVKKKYEAREAVLKKREEAGGGLTREELIRCLADAVNSTDKDGNHVTNVQAAKLLTELEGFSAATQDITVNIINYADAPDFYKTVLPE